jgi:hypothetical protein
MEIYENINNFCIILTCTVHINPNKNYVHMADPTERLKIYLKSINHWLNESTFKIVVVDNSGYTFPELNDCFEKYKDRFEIVSFVEKDIDDAVFANVGALAVKLTDNYLYTSKGTSEMFSIYYACQNSRLINKSKFVIKITGRYFVKELEHFLRNVNVDDYSALRQNNADQCEIVGCHMNAISQVFMPAHFVCSNGRHHHHIEALYKDKLLTKFPQERVLACDVFQIEPTQIGGGDTIKTEL